MLVLGALLGALLGAAAQAQPALETHGVAFVPRPGRSVGRDILLTDWTGRRASLIDIANGRPLLLVPAYFHCRNLCGVVRASLFHALAASGAVAGRDYTLAILSLRPSETTLDGRAARARDLEHFPLPGAAGGWHYLTGSSAALAAIETAIGLRVKESLSSAQLIHPAGVVALTADAVVSSYLLGVGFTPTATRAALAQARTGRIARATAPLLLLCFHLDPATGRYTLVILKLLELAAALTVGAVAALLWLLRRRERAA
jgi:protein SCO1/2